MKASLVSATSLAALLAFEASPALGGPVFDLSASSAQSSCSNVHSPSDCTLTFYALPGQAASAQTATMKAQQNITGKLTFDAAPSGFSGAAKTMSSNLATNSTFTSNAYGFTGASSAGTAGESTTATGTITANVASGTGKAPNPAQTSNLTFSGVTVAPIQSVTNGDAGNILVGQSGSATVSVSNTGHGNLANGGSPSSATNLNGSITSVATQGFSGSGSASISLADTSSSTFTYVYTPTARGANSATVTATFTNGKSDGTNNADSATRTIKGTGVAPVLGSVSGSDAGFVLVNSSKSVSVTVSNTGDGNTSGAGSISNLNGTLGVASGMFSGGAHTVSLADTSSAAFTYVFTPTQIGASSTSVSASFSNGSLDGKNLANSTSATISGTGVAPIQSVSSVSPVYARVGGVSTSSVLTVQNVGNGNLSGLGSASNLNGSVGAITGTSWSGSGGALGGGGGLADAASQTFNYTYAPQTARGSSSSGAITVGFTNGSSLQNNASQSVNVNLVGNTVGPVYQSKWPGGADNTPGKNGGSPTSTIDFGTVSSASSHTQLLQLLNITTDDDGGNADLTNLSIESFTITGLDAANFSIKGAQSGTGTKGTFTPDIITKGGNEFVSINFDAKGVAAGYNAILTLFTDEDAGLGASGSVYAYSLAALSVITPEPASMLLLSIGLGGVLVVSKRRNRVN